jgi:hypothetical protein
MEFEVVQALFGTSAVTVCVVVWLVGVLVTLVRLAGCKIDGRPRDVSRKLKAQLALTLMVGGLVIAVLVAVHLLDHRTPQMRAVAAIEEARGRVTHDRTKPDRPVVGVSFRDSMAGGFLGGQLSDTDLGRLRPQLEALPQLRDLDLAHTALTDAGLVHLYGLTQLETLSLGGGFRPTALTEAGVAKLRAALPRTKVYFYGGGIVIPAPITPVEGPPSR